MSIISSEGRFGLTVDFELRSGNIHPYTDIERFLKQSLDKLPKTIASTRTRIRADNSFYDKDLVNFLDDNHLGYVIVARLTRPVKNMLAGISYQDFQRNWEVGEFYYKPCSWKKEHRFIGIRHLIEETDFPITLFNIKGTPIVLW